MTGCDGLGSTGSLSHFIYMFIHLYVWFLCEKNLLLITINLFNRLMYPAISTFFMWDTEQKNISIKFNILVI